MYCTFMSIKKLPSKNKITNVYQATLGAYKNYMGGFMGSEWLSLRYMNYNYHLKDKAQCNEKIP